MTYALTAEQLEIREAVARLCQRFGDDYWLKKDSEGGFPHEFHQAMAEAGWLGVAMPVRDRPIDGLLQEGSEIVRRASRLARAGEELGLDLATCGEHRAAGHPCLPRRG